MLASSLSNNETASAVARICSVVAWRSVEPNAAPTIGFSRHAVRSAPHTAGPIGVEPSLIKAKGGIRFLL
jgi:hypothetical protein